MQDRDLKKSHTELNELTEELNDALADFEERLGQFGVPASTPCVGKPGFSFRLKRRDRGFVVLFYDDKMDTGHELSSASRETRIRAVESLGNLVSEVLKIHAAETVRVRKAISEIDALSESVGKELEKREV